MKRIVLFASGSGTNVENIVNYFQGRDDIAVEAVLTNKREAFVVDRCNKLNISALCFNRASFSGSDLILKHLKCTEPDLIVLAGFLWKMPPNIVRAFEGRIINIHPALLPKFGGKGMYGIHVHRAVKEEMEKESGITIHYVNEKYDDGNIIFQARVSLDPEDRPEDIAQKVQRLEYEHFPKIIEKLLQEENE